MPLYIYDFCSLNHAETRVHPTYAYQNKRTYALKDMASFRTLTSENENAKGIDPAK